jgi:hypothetical protein
MFFIVFFTEIQNKCTCAKHQHVEHIKQKEFQVS